MAQATVPLETLYQMRDREKAIMRTHGGLLPEAVRAKSRDYYEALDELIEWRKQHASQTTKALQSPHEFETMRPTGDEGKR